MPDKNQINKSFYNNIRSVIDSARSYSNKAVNSAMVQAYWNIGKLISEYEGEKTNRSDYGKRIIEILSEQLTKDFGKGFTSTNLKYMRKFFLIFPIGHAVSDQLQVKKSHSLSDQSKLINNESVFVINNAINPELSWTHYRLLLKVENKTVRDFYIRETVENNWSTRQLDRQISSHYYERLISSKDQTAVRSEAASSSDKLLPKDIIKDPYVLEFLNLKSNNRFLEKDLETELIDKLQDFLLELGKGFAFVERQKRITADNDNFYIDLVFYNYILKCFVLIDLKIGKLTHQDIGQMDMYVRMYEDLKHVSGDNPTIGIILCNEKNATVAKYSVLSENEQLFASEYMLHLPSEDELQNKLQKEFEQIKIENKLKRNT